MDNRRALALVLGAAVLGGGYSYRKDIKNWMVGNNSADQENTSGPSAGKEATDKQIAIYQKILKDPDASEIDKASAREALAKLKSKRTADNFGDSVLSTGRLDEGQITPDVLQSNTGNDAIPTIKGGVTVPCGPGCTHTYPKGYVPPENYPASNRSRIQVDPLVFEEPLNGGEGRKTKRGGCEYDEGNKAVRIITLGTLGKPQWKCKK